MANPKDDDKSCVHCESDEHLAYICAHCASLGLRLRTSIRDGFESELHLLQSIGNAICTMCVLFPLLSCVLLEQGT